MPQAREGATVLRAVGCIARSEFARLLQRSFHEISDSIERNVQRSSCDSWLLHAECRKEA